MHTKTSRRKELESVTREDVDEFLESSKKTTNEYNKTIQNLLAEKAELEKKLSRQQEAISLEDIDQILTPEEIEITSNRIKKINADIIYWSERVSDAQQMPYIDDLKEYISERIEKIKRKYPLTRKEVELLKIETFNKYIYTNYDLTGNLRGIQNFDPSKPTDVDGIKRKFDEIESNIKARLAEEEQEYLPGIDTSENLIDPKKIELVDYRTYGPVQADDSLFDMLNNINKKYSELKVCLNGLKSRQPIVRDVDSFTSLQDFTSWAVSHYCILCSNAYRDNIRMGLSQRLEYLNNNIRNINGKKTISETTLKIVNDNIESLEKEIKKVPEIDNVNTSKLNDLLLDKFRKKITYLDNIEDYHKEIIPIFYDNYLDQIEKYGVYFDKFSNIKNRAIDALSSVFVEYTIEEPIKKKIAKENLNLFADCFNTIKEGLKNIESIIGIRKIDEVDDVDINKCFAILCGAFSKGIGLDFRPIPNFFMGMAKKYKGIKNITDTNNCIRVLIETILNISKFDALDNLFLNAIYSLIRYDYVEFKAVDKIRDPANRQVVIDNFTKDFLSKLYNLTWNLREGTRNDVVISSYNAFGGFGFKNVQPVVKNLFKETKVKSDVLNKFTSKIMTFDASTENEHFNVFELVDILDSPQNEDTKRAIFDFAVQLIKLLDNKGKRKLKLNDENITPDLLVNYLHHNIRYIVEVKDFLEHVGSDTEFTDPKNKEPILEIFTNLAKSEKEVLQITNNEEDADGKIESFRDFMRECHNKALNLHSITNLLKTNKWKDYIEYKNGEGGDLESFSVKYFTVLMDLESIVCPIETVTSADAFMNIFLENCKEKIAIATASGLIEPNIERQFKILIDLYFSGKEIHFELNNEYINKMKDVVRKCGTALRIITQVLTVKEYTKRCNPEAYGEDFDGEISKEKLIPYKDKNLFKLDFQINENIRWRVLKDYDPAIWSVGDETHCCQTYGGYGHWAAADSYVNKLASVVVLEMKNGNDWTLVAQCYFHYVPEDNGFILDNIEGVNKFKYQSIVTASLFKLGEYCKVKLGASYLLLGKAYSECLDQQAFGNGSMSRDPRHFAVADEYDDLYRWDLFDNDNCRNRKKPYSDFARDGNVLGHWDLYKTNIEFDDSYFTITKESSKILRMLLIKYAGRNNE